MEAKDDSQKDELIRIFIDRYLPRNEIIHRLPLSVPISVFWTELTEARKKLRTELPLTDNSGRPFWFVINKSIEEQCDVIAAFARRDHLLTGPVFDTMAEEAVLEEAVYSSIIEGAFTTRKEASAFILGNKVPKNKSEQMVRNNYDALTFVLEHLDEPITEEKIIRIARIVTLSASEVHVDGYRKNQVYVNSRNGPVYIPPKAEAISGMMRQLLDFIQNSPLHPVLKACAAHFYFVYIHPFEDGNGRTARALSLMILIRSGYDFFRYFSISDIVSKERGKYYRSISDVEEYEGDMTYFIDFYSSMLVRALKKMEEHLRLHVFADQKITQLEATGKLNDRQMKGAKWLLQSGQTNVTVEAWKKKFKTATETARRDLLALCDCKLLTRSVEGRKAVFRIVRN